MGSSPVGPTNIDKEFFEIFLTKVWNIEIKFYINIVIFK